ncbi:hypothetical protein [Streptomyces sp. NPDC087300]|uniref:hypothetical protein n=1 Tax=Streptomyces sp. NPDC087300 TaxID=3365780 RepID=UPI0038281710
MLTGQRWCATRAVVRPCRRCGCDPCSRCGGGALWGSASGWTPVLDDGKWFNIECGTCAPNTGCGCGDVPSLALDGPVAEVHGIIMDGQPLPEGSWRVYDEQILVRLGGAEWPRCQDLTRPLTERGTWAVDYTRGHAPPLEAAHYAGLLACELAKPPGECRLDPRVTQLSQDGVTYSFDPATFFAEGMTGLREIDLWLMALRQPSHQVGMWHPDMDYPMQSTGPFDPLSPWASPDRIGGR